MTREEAIAYGNDYYRDLITACCEIGEKHKGFVRMSLEALKKEPREGRWIIDGHHRKCPICGEYFCIKDAEGNEIPSSFCPNCGADMREGKE